MSVGKFFKYAVYIYFGLKLDSSATDQSQSDAQIEAAREKFLKSVKACSEEDALLQEHKEERKCAESMHVLETTSTETTQRRCACSGRKSWRNNNCWIAIAQNMVFPETRQGKYV
ncbi:hypothetical protein CAEBREN_19801 [Caenorhabditis brenneri]|uniref:Uncharacterized protein n=1 Tax=Caenorhabditis brenneri TaxID=135651 RepID=G0PLI8_CAEBE|nr:hypothetical protein CAEBREN_19801 [Caenorhabditis brenneri]